MKFIHCSDIHLDSRMETSLPPEKARERNGELLQTFQRLARTARDQGVTAVLLAGDLFDTDRVTSATAERVLDAIREQPSVDFLYLRGNHDESRRAFAGRELPPNLRLFSEEWRTYRYGDMTVSGIEITDTNQDSFYDSLSLREEDTNLVMLHGQISRRSGKDRVCLPRLMGKHIRYLALGHYHSFQAGALDEKGSWCYSGCLEGRGFDECGEKGYVLVEVEDGQVTTRFVPFATRTLLEIPVDITGLQSEHQIFQAMEKAAANVPPGSMVKFVLQGTIPPDTRKDIAFLEQSFPRRFYFTRVRDESRLAISPQDYVNDVSLRGEFVRLVLASGRPREEQERMLLWGLQALKGEEVQL